MFQEKKANIEIKEKEDTENLFKIKINLLKNESIKYILVS